jgi:hypothetical protein
MSPDVIHVTAIEDKAMLALQDKLDRLLAKAKPSKRELTQQYFRDLYPKLEAHLASGKLLKDVLGAFNELVQAKVCARTFNEMLEQERARRDEAGNPIGCVACGQPLKSAQQTKATRPQLSGSLIESADFPPTYSE